MSSISDLKTPNSKARCHWFPAATQLLGQVPDEDVALQLGRSVEAVIQKRRKLRIAKFNSRLRRWTQEEDEWLRTMRNRDFSSRFGRTLVAIQQRRKNRGIPQPKRHARPWTSQEDDLLGKITDRDCALQLKRPQLSVIQRRRQLGIPAFHPLHRAWSKAEDELLGTMPDGKLAKRLGRTLVGVRVRRVRLRISVMDSKSRPWRAVDDQLLGKRPDEQVTVEILLGGAQPKGNWTPTDTLEQMVAAAPQFNEPKTNALRPDVLAAQADLNQSQANLKLQKAMRIYAVRRSRPQNHGGHRRAVEKNGSLAEVESPDFGQAQADARKAEGDLKLAEHSLAREQELFAHGAAAQKDVEAAEDAQAQAEAEHSRAVSKIAAYGANADSLDEIFVLRSPLAGTVVDKSTSAGQEVRPDQMLANMPEITAPLFVVSDPAHLWIQIDATEVDVPRLQPGREFTFTSRAFPDETFTGRVDKVSEFVDPNTRTIKVAARWITRAAAQSRNVRERNSARRRKPKHRRSGGGGFS